MNKIFSAYAIGAIGLIICLVCAVNDSDEKKLKIQCKEQANDIKNISARLECLERVVEKRIAIEKIRRMHENAKTKEK